jgi:hypothetical protein
MREIVEVRINGEEYVLVEGPSPAGARGGLLLLVRPRRERTGWICRSRCGFGPCIKMGPYSGNNPAFRRLNGDGSELPLCLFTSGGAEQVVKHGIMPEWEPYYGRPEDPRGGEIDE